MRITKLILFFGTLCLLGFYFCRKAEKKPAPSPVQKAEALMPQGKWQVTYFIENGNDKGRDLKGYEFVFEKDGAAYATKGDKQIKGSWTSVPNTRDEHLLMSFVVWPTDGLSKSWQITEASHDKIHLVNRGDTEEKSHLILERK
jgi:hypothetical protein